MDTTGRTFRKSFAKINLTLSIVGQRPDGFHNLVSLVAPISLADIIFIKKSSSQTNKDILICDCESVPTDASNLILKASNLFREKIPDLPFVEFYLEKKIPMGAGLGGGSSNAVTALFLLNDLSEKKLATEELFSIAKKLGSDCPLFLYEAPIIMRGRGDEIEILSKDKKECLSGRKFLIFKPVFGISTVEVYRKLRNSSPMYYDSTAFAEEQIERFFLCKNTTPASFYNSLEKAVFEKYIALPVLFDILFEKFSINAHMSGSGSACFFEITEKNKSYLSEIKSEILSSWGDSTFIEEVVLLAK